MKNNLTLITGCAKDYDALAQHHYRAGRPATMMRVLAFHDHTPTPTSRFTRTESPSRTAAVLVESMPALHCRSRDDALNSRYSAVKCMKLRAAMLKCEMRCISRVIVHPQYRSLGLAGQLVEAALRTSTTPFTEAIAAMGRVHPFFERAGMTAYQRPRLETDQRLIDAFRKCHIQPAQLADTSKVLRIFEQLPSSDNALLMREVSHWYNAVQRGKRDTDISNTNDKDKALAIQFRRAQQRLLSEPIYFLHDNRSIATP